MKKQENIMNLKNKRRTIDYTSIHNNINKGIFYKKINNNNHQKKEIKICDSDKNSLNLYLSNNKITNNFDIKISQNNISSNISQKNNVSVLNRMLDNNNMNNNKNNYKDNYKDNYTDN